MDANLEDLDARVRIRDLYSRYCFAIDLKDAAALADCFTEDGAFVNEHGEYVGREAVNELLLPAPETHYSVNVEVIGGGAGTYKSRACFILIHAGDGGIASYGQYDDTVRQGRDGCWRFARREVNFLWMSEEYAAYRSQHSDA